MIRIIFAFLGFLFAGFRGGFLGFGLGWVLEYTFSLRTREFREQYSSDEIELNMLLLSALVIKSDGKVSESELEYVRHHFNRMFGEVRSKELFHRFNVEVKNNPLSLEQVCLRLRNSHRMTYSTRLQIIYFLFGLAQSDGQISSEEVQQITLTARYLNISVSDFESIRAMFYQRSTTAEYRENPYKILEIRSDATDEQVKKAYREMAKKYHPDKVQTQSEVLRKGAEEKFKKIQEAYEQIQRERKSRS